MMSANKKTKFGFTLIEMMVTVAIIAMMASIAIASYADAAKSGRDGKRKADIEAIRQALVLRRSDVGNYPSGNGAIAALTTGTPLSGYISDPFPADPIPTRSYTYFSNGSSFCLCAYIESAGKGNSTAQATDVSCSFGTGNYYCATNP